MWCFGCVGTVEICGIWMADHTDTRWTPTLCLSYQVSQIFMLNQKNVVENDGLWMCIKWNLVFAFIILILLLFLTHSLAALYNSSTAHAHWNPNERENFMAWQWQQGGINFNKNYFSLLAAFFRLLCWFRCDVFSFSLSSAYHSSCHVVQVIASFLCFLK